MKRKQLYISISILLIGFLAAFALVKLKKKPEKTKPQIKAPLVEVIEVKVSDVQMIVQGYGTVKPKTEINIVPQVSGKVVEVNPSFKAGEFVDADTVLIKIDDRDYELVVRQAKAGVAEAQVKLDLEKAEAQVAKQEWEQLNPGTEPSSPLVLREPQIRQAQAKLESARANLDIAKLALERTKVTLPVDTLIIKESVDLGQYIMAGVSIGTAYGIDAVQIAVPLEDKELALFDIPSDRNASVNGYDKAEVHAKFAGADWIWQGRVVRTTGQVDPASRLIYVIIEVSDPFKKSLSSGALLPGTFVEVFIKGKTLESVVSVPREAIRNGKTIWVYNEGQLVMKEPDIIRMDRDFAYIRNDLQDGDLIITSSLDAAIDGMSIRIHAEEQEK